jgi:CBS domain-containing protein
MEPKETKESRQADSGKVEDKPVKGIVEPTKAVASKSSVQGALDEITEQEAETAPVTDPDGKLLGMVSKGGMNREVGGLGHDPESFPVEPQVKTDSPYCKEDQTIGEAEKIMRDANIQEVPVVNCDKVLVGKTNLQKIEKEKEERGADGVRNDQ